MKWNEIHKLIQLCWFRLPDFRGRHKCDTRLICIEKKWSAERLQVQLVVALQRATTCFPVGEYLELLSCGLLLLRPCSIALALCWCWQWAAIWVDRYRSTCSSNKKRTETTPMERTRPFLPPDKFRRSRLPGDDELPLSFSSVLPFVCSPCQLPLKHRGRLPKVMSSSGISSCFSMSFGSCWTALTNIFWVQHDPVNSSYANRPRKRAIAKLRITRLFINEFCILKISSIALEKLYLKSFGLDTIWWSDQLQIRFRTQSDSKMAQCHTLK